MTTVQHDAPHGAVTILRVVNFLNAVAAELKSRHEARITRRALAQLSERQLSDIGLTRDYVDAL
ncbi:DUF1127 domain-containing protein [Sedimentitalea todarodis]|uniref:DUF1127 domain-containing protein n=1 Tax=Sedimentitalea todarodis TaxID=1631240 RepID=A0ABU3VIP2_9RHOB|nr:DUF1127 domain-containing protein [Sedimentitalea todarodis]MDU9006042.1 DUF1127 domain-containing protein [Sedimentitalea todarodis]